MKSSPDGGSTWANINLGADDNKDVLFLSTDTGFVAGENGIFKTTDGGNNWNSVSSVNLVVLKKMFAL
ncbi:MAG: hypothetical protein U5L96_04340 [Owenweeksia sp.]|nr:hypothetical protein [Owenweeksia sp.]